ncbi:MAG: hypothetical protein LBB37_01065 [Endomicrobium sp.]|jgi:hypothetical protein|nr:hypothetical protein [Endomicrobium sp.]
MKKLVLLAAMLCLVSQCWAGPVYESDLNEACLPDTEVAEIETGAEIAARGDRAIDLMLGLLDDVPAAFRTTEAEAAAIERRRDIMTELLNEETDLEAGLATLEFRMYLGGASL